MIDQTVVGSKVPALGWHLPFWMTVWLGYVCVLRDSGVSVVQECVKVPVCCNTWRQRKERPVVFLSVAREHLGRSESRPCQRPNSSLRLGPEGVSFCSSGSHSVINNSAADLGSSFHLTVLSPSILLGT